MITIDKWKTITQNGKKTIRNKKTYQKNTAK
jgi:hypothetical protein